jgi:hypothetical protein
MEYGKYIIKEVRGVEVAILFDPLISHCDLGTKGDSRGETLSAGFFGVMSMPTREDPNDVDVSTWGKSITLNITSRDGDDDIIKKVVRR